MSSTKSRSLEILQNGYKLAFLAFYVLESEKNHCKAEILFFYLIVYKLRMLEYQQLNGDTDIFQKTQKY